MYSNSDFEKVWFFYKTESKSKGISINIFCVSQGVLYNQFNDWFHMLKLLGIEIVDREPGGLILRYLLKRYEQSRT